MIDPQNIQTLLQPIHADIPQGKNIEFSDFYDAIREARRSDLQNIAQGEWVTEVKKANWYKVLEIAENVLKNHSKDLQIIVWYIEALVHTQGFVGLQIGFKLLDGWLSDYWDLGFPIIEEDDLHPRAIKIEWLCKEMTTVLKSYPLILDGETQLSYLDWIGAQQANTSEGADTAYLTTDKFLQSVKNFGFIHYKALLDKVIDAYNGFKTLEEHLEKKFVNEFPDTYELRTYMLDLTNLVKRLGQEFPNSLSLDNKEQQEEKQHIGLVQHSQSEVDSAGHLFADAKQSDSFGSGSNVRITKPNSRQEAIAFLLSAAKYFRENEPQSPVPALAEKAAKWANMSLQEWLLEVIKDEKILNEINGFLSE